MFVTYLASNDRSLRILPAAGMPHSSSPCVLATHMHLYCRKRLLSHPRTDALTSWSSRILRMLSKHPAFDGAHRRFARYVGPREAEDDFQHAEQPDDSVEVILALGVIPEPADDLRAQVLGEVDPR